MSLEQLGAFSHVLHVCKQREQTPSTENLYQTLSIIFAAALTPSVTTKACKKKKKKI